MINLFNPITNKKELLNKKTQDIYLCGPTVYDEIHLGNLRPVIVFDFLTRLLKEKKIEYKYVHNITDIDDKIIIKSQELNVSEEEVSNKYRKSYLSILESMNILMPHEMPLVTKNIQVIIDLISDLLMKEKAYLKDGDVIFDLSKATNYMELSKQKVEMLKGNTDCHDFVLWKKTENGKKWNSPWSEGRPGWHIECFAFIKNIFKKPIDIHGGGIDLKFPHHENENIISHAIFEQPLSRIWTHVGHLQMNKEKISKSNNNKFIVKELLEGDYSPNFLRYIFLLSNYESPLEINEEKMLIFYNEWIQFEKTIYYSKSILILENQNIVPLRIETNKVFLDHWSNNLNMPNVLSWLVVVKNNLLTAIKNTDYSTINLEANNLKHHLCVLGFLFPNIHNEKNINLLKEWKEALFNKEFINADVLRKELQSRNLII